MAVVRHLPAVLARRGRGLGVGAGSSCGCRGLAAAAAGATKAARAAPGLLAQLPDFVTGSELLEAGRFGEASESLHRAVEVAEAYFPEAAARERALCHSAYGRCLWYAGHYAETAAQFEAGVKALRDGRGPSAALAQLATAAARSHFEAGRLDLAAPLLAEALAGAPPGAGPAPRLVAAALAAARGEAAAAGEEAEAEAEAEAIRRTNRLVAEVLVEGDGQGAATAVAAAALEAELSEGGVLARLLAADSEVSAMTLMALRSTAGQLAVAAGQGSQPWARPLLAAALKDFEALRPGGPTLQPLLFRTLSALGTLTGSAGDAVTSEGLFRAAVDHIEEALLGTHGHAHDSKRGRLWRAQVFFGFAELLATGRRAEQRASEIAQLRGRAAAALTGQEEAEADVALVALSPEQMRWALVYLPPPESLRTDDLFVE